MTTPLAENTTGGEKHGFATDRNKWSNSVDITTATPALSNVTSMFSTAFSPTSDLGLDNGTVDDGEKGHTTEYSPYPGEAAYYDVYMYPGFQFERLIYMFAWEILVIITCLVNTLVIIVLLSKSMRNATNMILVAIAISDSLTGLVTLPSYIMVHQRFEHCEVFNGLPNVSYHHYETTTDGMPLYGYNDYNISDLEFDAVKGDCERVYTLTKDLCRFFMISKLFVSKAFHTMSIWLTLFLSFHRYTSVAYPFQARTLFTTARTIIICSVLAVLAPILHIYHLLNEKADNGMCRWILEKTCEGSCAHLWITFLLRHFIPCVLLVIFTVLFIVQLTTSANEAKRLQSHVHQPGFRKRQNDNRRISIIVATIVIVFLIPEIPYGGFLLSSVIKHLNHTPMNLKENRKIHAIYEISMVLSFHADFYIYTFLNKRFRIGLKKTFKCILRPAFGMLRRHSRATESHSTSSNTATYVRTGTSNGLSKTVIPLENMSRSAPSKDSNDMPSDSTHDEESTKFIQLNSGEDVKLQLCT